VPDLNVFRSDVAKFFQPSIDCIVEAVHEQKNSAHKMISVSLYTSLFTMSFPNHLLFVSMSCLWAGLPRATGYSPKYMKDLLPLDLTSFVLKTTCGCSLRLE
jgi:hypothetical protein